MILEQHYAIIADDDELPKHLQSAVDRWYSAEWWLSEECTEWSAGEAHVGAATLDEALVSRVIKRAGIKGEFYIGVLGPWDPVLISKPGHDTMALVMPLRPGVL